MKDELIPLHDILTEIAFLNSVRERATFDSFKANSADVRAASYAIMVISEAVRRIDLWLLPAQCDDQEARQTLKNAG